MRYVGIWVHPYTVITQLKMSQILAILGDSRVEMMPWCNGWGWLPTLILPTSILDICKVFFHLSIRYVSTWVHPYTVTPLKLGQILAILGDCQVEMMPWCYGWGWLPPLIASHVHRRHLKSVLAPFNEVPRHISAPLHCYTAENGSEFGNSG